MWISEVFESIQGEGRWLGTPSTFVRTSGCNLRCTFCDTPYTSWRPAGDERSLDSLLEEVEQHTAPHLVLTGGEPLLTPESVALTRAFRERGRVITVETAGTVFREVAADLISLSPKLSNSTPRGSAWEARHEQRRHRPDVIRQLISAYDYQFKFVVAAPEDVDEIEQYLDEFPEVRAEHVYLMPEGVDAAVLKERMEWLRPLAESRGWRVSPRLHIELFGNRRGV